MDDRPSEGMRLRLAARALYGMDDAGVIPSLAPEHLRAASASLGWTVAGAPRERLCSGRRFEPWSKGGRTADVPLTAPPGVGKRGSGDAWRWGQDVSAWATSMAGVDIAPCEALAAAIEARDAEMGRKRP